jgi:hypothetical protein
MTTQFIVVQAEVTPLENHLLMMIGTKYHQHKVK